MTGHFGLGPDRTFAALVSGLAKAEAPNRTAAAAANPIIFFISILPR
jgi:hypothetical protein